MPRRPLSETTSPLSKNGYFLPLPVFLSIFQSSHCSISLAKAMQFNLHKFMIRGPVAEGASPNGFGTLPPAQRTLFSRPGLLTLLLVKCNEIEFQYIENKGLSLSS